MPLIRMEMVPPHVRAPRALLLGYSCDILPVENPERLLERLNFLFPPSHPVLVAHASIHAGGLKLVKVSEGGIQLLLGSLQVSLSGGQCLLLVLFFFASLCSTSFVFAALSTLESVMNESYSF